MMCALCIGIGLIVGGSSGLLVLGLCKMAKDG